MDNNFVLHEQLMLFGNNKFITFRNSGNEDKVYKYNEIISLSQTLLKTFKENGMVNARISLQYPHSPELCIILLSILNCESSFCGIPYNCNENDVCTANKDYRARFLVSHICWSKIDSLQLIQELKILDKTIYIFEIMTSKNEALEETVPCECYSIKTSGTTGVSNVVRVPVHCILPNIKSLSKLLELTSKDQILLSSPITFDPFVIEFFLALWNGSSLLIIESSLKLEPRSFANALKCVHRDGVSIMQMTPSLFRRFGLATIRDDLLSANTSLRILLLGGEHFPPTSEISAWTVNNNWQTRIFNIYGITEVSCWSTIHEIKRDTNDDRIPIGLPIDEETEIRVLNEINNPITQGRGHIQIGSATRKCVIGEEYRELIFSSDLLFRSTGDIGYIEDGKIFYEGRKNDIVKRYGNRVNLSHIREIISAIDGVLNAYCGYNEKNMELICFISKKNFHSEEEIKSNILGKLKNAEKPDDIRFVNHFPLTSHGKVSKEALFESIASKAETPLERLEIFIKNVLGIDSDFQDQEENPAKKRKCSLNLSFLNAGGTSFQALTLATQIESISKRPEPLFLKMLLDETSSLSTLLDLVRNLPYDNTAKLSEERILNSFHRELLTIAWEYDTGKCVDATPACYKTVVSVGSHSHLLVTLDSTTGQNISSCILPDRIECRVRFFEADLLLVGCYDGKLYVINHVEGKIEWHFDCGGMIKSRPLQKNILVVIGNYSNNGNVVCLNMKERKVEWKLQLGSKGIFSSPVELNNDSVLICSLSGEVANIMLINGNILWKAKFHSPIFSTPARLNNAVIIADVSGKVHCLQISSGTELWSFESDGNIFSSIVIHKEIDHDYRVIFGCHDHNVYCLQIKQENKSPSIAWRKELDSAIYSTCAVLYLRSHRPAVISCSTHGNVYVLDYFSGSIIFTIRLKGEIFSSPIVWGRSIYVGCRDNNLVCLKM